MNNILKTALLLLVLITLVGCESPQQIFHHKRLAALPDRAEDIEIIDEKWIYFTLDGQRYLFLHMLSSNSYTTAVTAVPDR